MRSALCPSMENNALCPDTCCSSFTRAAPASARISCCCARATLRHSAQRKWNIWCSTLEPSSVSGTACKFSACVRVSALPMDAMLFLCCDCSPGALILISYADCFQQGRKILNQQNSQQEVWCKNQFERQNGTSQGFGRKEFPNQNSTRQWQLQSRGS